MPHIPRVFSFFLLLLTLFPSASLIIKFSQPGPLFFLSVCTLCEEKRYLGVFSPLTNFSLCLFSEDFNPREIIPLKYMYRKKVFHFSSSRQRHSCDANSRIHVPAMNINMRKRGGPEGRRFFFKVDKMLSVFFDVN